MSEHTFYQHIKEPTHITQSASTCLDLIFKNFDRKNTITTVKELGFSDHLSTSISIQLSTPQHTQPIWYTEKRIFSHTNIERFKELLKATNWSTIINPNNNTNENYTAFSNTLSIILNQSIPKQKIKLKTKFKHNWLTKGLKVSCKNKRLLKIFTLQTKNQTIHQYYRKYEKTLKKTV
jgi:hypothetical protein